MAHQLSEELVALCRLVRKSHPDTLTPDELAHAHKTLLNFPAEMQLAIGCTTAYVHVKQAAEAILDLKELIGAARWPASPQEVARRHIRSFSFQTPWELHVYQNGSEDDVRTKADPADCTLIYQQGSWVWSVYPSPECKWVPGHRGAEESVQDAYGMIGARLQEMTASTRQSSHQRRTDDINKPRARA